ncbi:uncharacterized protein [Procambarus clarkii]|uniref:uncharacterized protein n=1 Tax=Procambarus clarkii TaxID=6728 RepID=UPI003742A491
MNSLEAKHRQHPEVNRDYPSPTLFNQGATGNPTASHTSPSTEDELPESPKSLTSEQASSRGGDRLKAHRKRLDTSRRSSELSPPSGSTVAEPLVRDRQQGIVLLPEEIHRPDPVRITSRSLMTRESVPETSPGLTPIEHANHEAQKLERRRDGVLQAQRHSAGPIRDTLSPPGGDCIHPDTQDPPIPGKVTLEKRVRELKGSTMNCHIGRLTAPVRNFHRTSTLRQRKGPPVIAVHKVTIHSRRAEFDNSSMPGYKLNVAHRRHIHPQHVNHHHLNCRLKREEREAQQRKEEREAETQLKCEEREAQLKREEREAQMKREEREAQLRREEQEREARQRKDELEARMRQQEIEANKDVELRRAELGIAPPAPPQQEDRRVRERDLPVFVPNEPEGKSYAETARDMERKFLKWLDSEGARTVEEVKGLMVMKKFMSVLSPEIRIMFPLYLLRLVGWVADKVPDSNCVGRPGSVAPAALDPDLALP